MHKSNKDNIIKNHVLINNNLHEVNFLVFDAVVLSGVNIGHMKFKNRLQELSNFFKKIKFQRFMEEAKEKFMINYKNYPFEMNALYVSFMIPSNLIYDLILST